MASWWDMGEWSGFDGATLVTWRITCPFCNESGNFSTEYDATKKKPNERKVLHFTTLKCGNCAGYVMALWSPNSSGSSIHDFRVLPWPQRVQKAPEFWPEDVSRYWIQAHRTLQDENWDASVVMSRSAMQIALRDKEAKGSNLKQEIDDLAAKSILPPIITEWAHELRCLGNECAHPEPGQEPTTSKDAKDILQFLDYLLQYLYTLPHQINQYRGRKGDNNT